MKLIAALLLPVATTTAFAGFKPMLLAPPRSSSALQMSTGIYYSTIGGNTKRCAEMIANAADIPLGCEIEDLKDLDAFCAHDSIIVGAPTWNTGAPKERSMTGWDQWLYNVLPKLDLDGKKIAVFGCGDSGGYPFNYCDAVGELHDEFAKVDGTDVTFGRISKEGYRFVNSKAEVEEGGNLLFGMLFDEDNESEKSASRAEEWVKQLKEEGFMG